MKGEKRGVPKNERKEKGGGGVLKKENENEGTERKKGKKRGTEKQQSVAVTKGQSYNAFYI